MAQEYSIPVIIANSHAGIYDFVHEQVPLTEKLLVYNLVIPDVIILESSRKQTVEIDK